MGRASQAKQLPSPSVLAALHPEADARLSRYLDGIGDILRTKRRREGFALYACGIFGEGARKSVEPIASRACGSPALAEAMHRKLLRFVGESQWEDRPLREYATRYAVEQMQRRGPVRHWIVDDTGFLKQGKHSPGVQRQYTGSAGKTANCQVAVSLSVANEHAHVPVDMQLYLPQSWADDRKRCRAAKIPEELGYRPKWRMALEMIEAAVDVGISPGVVLADADYGNRTQFRDKLDELKLSYAVAVQKNTSVCRVQGTGKSREVGQRVSVEELAFELDPSPPCQERARRFHANRSSKEVTTSFSRPRVSNDNPLSESQFRTLNYAPGFPNRFDAYDHALDYYRGFFEWYSHHHRHDARRVSWVAGVRVARSSVAHKVPIEPRPRLMHGVLVLATLPWPMRRLSARLQLRIAAIKLGPEDQVVGFKRRDDARPILTVSVSLDGRQIAVVNIDHVAGLNLGGVQPCPHLSPTERNTVLEYLQAIGPLKLGEEASPGHISFRHFHGSEVERLLHRPQLGVLEQVLQDRCLKFIGLHRLRHSSRDECCTHSPTRRQAGSRCRSCIRD